MKIGLKVLVVEVRKVERRIIFEFSCRHTYLPAHFLSVKEQSYLRHISTMQLNVAYFLNYVIVVGAHLMPSMVSGFRGLICPTHFVTSHVLMPIYNREKAVNNIIIIIIKCLYKEVHTQ